MQKIAILYDASQAILSTFDLDEVLRQILAIVRDYFHLQNASIFFLDKEAQKLVVKSAIGWAPDRETTCIRVGTGLTGTAVREMRPIYAPDVSKDVRYLCGWAKTRSELAIPLMVHEEVIGVLDCQSENLDHFHAETIDLLTLFSTQASMAVQNAQLYSSERKRAQQLEVMNTIAQQMTVVMEIPELLAKVCSLVRQAFNVDHVAVMLKEENDLVLRAHHGTLTLAVMPDVAKPSCQGWWGTALSSEKTLVHNDVQPGTPDALFRETRSRMCIPLISFGQKLGVLALASASPRAFQEGDQKSLESVADMCATAIQNARHVERVRQLAYIDGLTGIFNRRFFELRIGEEIERAKRFNAGMAVIMIDIDHFKRLNDEFGHLLGDEVLRQVSSIFSQHLRKIDVVCRYGGEEFVIVLSQTDAEHAIKVAQKLRNLVGEWQFPGVPRPVYISAGVATFPEHGTERDQLVKAADNALYTAKQTGRNRVCLATAKANSVSA
ncbi:MAG TPA: sensor domain-containing diguanylate cyclase [Terriglobales bacterium]|nr:sensor domain-containing diguanylate cyclase [Terriglobales bacterium]